MAWQMTAKECWTIALSFFFTFTPLFLSLSVLSQYLSLAGVLEKARSLIYFWTAGSHTFHCWCLSCWMEFDSQFKWRVILTGT